MPSRRIKEKKDATNVSETDESLSYWVELISALVGFTRGCIDIHFFSPGLGGPWPGFAPRKLRQ
jgi:hypothetical protein